MKKLKSILSMLLAVSIIVAMFIVPVNADVTDNNTLTGINGKATYQFTGDNADRSGYAEGTITFDSVVNKQYNIYWANESGVLAEFEKIADKLKATSKTTTFSFGRNVAIPEGATSLVIYDTNISTALNRAYDIINIPEAKQITAESQMTFASVSDIHVNYDSDGIGASNKWTKALNYFDEIGLEYVFISGDVSSNATTSEMETYKAAVEASTYDANRIYEARGNHESQNNANFIAYTSGGEEAGEIRPFKDSPYYYVLFEGDEGEKDNLFIFMAQELNSTGNSSYQDNWSSAQLDWVEDLLKKYTGTNTNIFLVQHTVFKGWGAGDSRVGAYSQPTYLTPNFPQNYRLKKLLQEYKEVIQMSGHTHISLYEDVNFSDENGTAARMIHNPSTSQPRWFNSTGGLDYNLATYTYGSEGYVVNVTADDVIYYGRNFSTGQFVPDACFILESYSENRDATKIEVTKLPTKTEYESGEAFDSTGMEVTAYYADGTSEVVKGYYVDTDTALKGSVDSVEVRFGNATAKIAISVASADSVFEGSGTVEDPYLIQTADDFNTFTKLMNSITGTGSHDNATVYGAGLYFKQTADINMTGYQGYVGTPATGNAKYGFAGVYDGAGHTLTVNITSNSFETSVFPYLNGLIMNLNVAGSITSTSNDGESSVQFVRTVGRSGAVVNCSSSLALKSKEARGLTLTMYGYTGNYVYDGTMDCTGADIFPITGNTNNEGTLSNVYYFAKNSSGANITGTYGTAGTNDDAVVEALNSEVAIAASLANIKKYNSSYTAETLGKWSVVDGVARVTSDSNEVSGDKNFKGEGTAENPYLIETADDFNKLTKFINAATGSSSHDTTAYGAGLFFKQTADIDMTGYKGYFGTPATGDAKHGFAGVYDGAGHTLTVNITSNSFETSVFPYLNGLLMNLNVAGSITSTSNQTESSVQFVRTVGRGGAVINCSSSLALKSKEARGLTLTMYGYTDRFVYNGTMDCTGADIFPITGNHADGTMTNAYYLAKSASGADIKHTNGTQYDDKTVLAAALNSGINAATIAKIESYGVDYDENTLVSWSNVGDMPRADGKVIEVQDPTFEAEKAEYAVNKAVTFTALLPDSVAKVAIANENGKYITSTSSYAASDIEGFNTWTITASFGTCGDRTVSLLTAEQSGKLVDSGLTASFSVVRVTAASNDPLKVLGVRAPETVNKNEVFTVTVITSTSATNVGILNESGNFMGKSSQSYIDKDDVREWTITMKVASKGSRKFAVVCSDNVRNWIPLEDAMEFTMGIK